MTVPSTAYGADVVAERVAALRALAADCGRDPAGITIVAVTKGRGMDVCRAAVEAGIADLGESYAQELATKAGQLAGMPVRWHMIGRVQRNKIDLAAPHVAMWQSVDRPALIEALGPRVRPGAKVLLQVDLAELPGRGGCPWAELPSLLTAARAADLTVTGLMGVGPPEDQAHTRRVFRRLAATARDLGLAEISMGMSTDVRVALEEGATTIRIGTGLFGPLPRQTPVALADDHTTSTSTTTRTHSTGA